MRVVALPRDEAQVAVDELLQRLGGSAPLQLQRGVARDAPSTGVHAVAALSGRLTVARLGPAWLALGLRVVGGGGVKCSKTVRSVPLRFVMAPSRKESCTLTLKMPLGALHLPRGKGC